VVIAGKGRAGHGFGEDQMIREPDGFEAEFLAELGHGQPLAAMHQRQPDSELHPSPDLCHARSTPGMVARGDGFAAWQPGDHFGAALRIEPGTYIASELGSSDLAKSKAFYSEVFGIGWGDNPEYAEAIAGGGFVFGAMPAEQYATFGRPQAPDYWLVYFAASDVEAVVRKAVKLGAAVLLDTTTNYLDQQYAILRDPQGATFGLNTPPPRYRN